MTDDETKRPSGYDIRVFTMDDERYGYRYCYCGKWLRPSRTYVFRVDGHDDEYDSDYGNFICLECSIKDIPKDIQMLKEWLKEIKKVKNEQTEEEDDYEQTG